jgi:glycosyltransferase involved in cell wall biosynthesis
MMSDVGDVEDMAKNCIYLLNNEDRLNKFRENAIARARKFDIHAILPKYEEIYESALEAVKVKS